MPCKSPQNYAWTNIVLDKGYQVSIEAMTYDGYWEDQILFLDQRGTKLLSLLHELQIICATDLSSNQRDWTQQYRDG